MPNSAGSRRLRWPRDGWRVLVALAAAALFLAPIAFMVTTSLRQIGVPLSRQLEVFPNRPPGTTTQRRSIWPEWDRARSIRHSSSYWRCR